MNALSRVPALYTRASRHYALGDIKGPQAAHRPPREEVLLARPGSGPDLAPEEALVLAADGSRPAALWRSRRRSAGRDGG